MKSFAHPVKNPDGTAQWCHEHTSDKPKVPPASTSGATEDAGPVLMVPGDLATAAYKLGIKHDQLLQLLDVQKLSEVKDLTGAYVFLKNWKETADSQETK